jgi:hypothetical protein
MDIVISVGEGGSRKSARTEMEWNGKRQFFQFKIMFTDNLS